MNLKQTLKKDGLIWIILIIPFVFLLHYWNQFPQQIPTHFNFKGEANGYSGKLFGLLFLPCLNILIYLFFLILPKIDPSGKNFALFPQKYKIIQVILQLFLLVIFFITMAFALGYSIKAKPFIDYSVIVFLLIFGNYLGSIRHNYFIGIRTPWTLADENNWKLTHRFAGKIWVAASLIMLILSFYFPLSETLFLIYIAVIAGIPVAYSFILFKKVMR